MRDLYKQLKISSSSSEEIIREAINSCRNIKLCKDAETVLLNPSIKKTYDKNHNVLTDIGKLRAQLGLSHSDNWYGSAAQDFTYDETKPLNHYSDFKRKLQPSVYAYVKRLLVAIFEVVKSLLIYAFVFSALIGVVSVIVSALDTDSKTDNKPEPKVQIQAPTPVFQEPEIQLPSSGFIRRHTSLEAIAPLEIRTDVGVNYFVKVEDANTGKDILDVIIRGGDDVSLDIPLGTYIIKYATGNTWYGYRHLFGPETGYTKADELFIFRQVGNQINGYTITLFRVQNGNLTTSPLSADQF